MQVEQNLTTNKESDHLFIFIINLGLSMLLNGHFQVNLKFRLRNCLGRLLQTIKCSFISATLCQKQHINTECLWKPR